MVSPTRPTLPGAASRPRDPGTLLKRRFRAAALAAACTLIVFVAWLAMRWGGRHTTKAFDDLIEMVAAFAASATCWMASRRRDASRISWLLLSAAAFSWGIGEAIWSYYELVLNKSVPFPSAADIGYLGLIPLAAAGIVLLGGLQARAASRLRALLDGLIIWGSLLFLSWSIVLGPLYRQSSTSLLEKAVGIAYPSGDLVIIATVLIIGSRGHRFSSFPFAMLGIALGMIAFSDTLFAYLNLNSTYATGSLVDTGWAAGFLLIALAGLKPVRPPGSAAGEAGAIGRLSVLMPYIAFPLVVAILGTTLLSKKHIDPILVIDGILVIALVIARQLMTLLDNVSLSRDLEAKVARRTRELAESEERFRSLVQNSSDVVTIISEDLGINYISPSAQTVLGYSPDETKGANLRDFIHPDDTESVLAVLSAALNDPGRRLSMDYRMARGDGTWCHAETTVANMLDDPSVGGIVLNTRDITERRQLEEQLRHLAFHDSLTALANRALFRDRVEHALRRARRTKEDLAAVFIDLDNFKNVNDSLGHGAGDQVLRAVAAGIQRALRPGDSVARLGGDEFAVLLESVADVKEAIEVADRMLSGIRSPISLAGREVVMEASAGIAMAQANLSVDDLLRNADVAMYMAKSKGKGRCEVFQASMHAAAVQRLELEAELRRAIDEQQFVLFYQPIVDLQTERVVGAEALIRWQHPRRGISSPAEFVAVGEETGLIVPMGRWILRTACKEARLWNDQAPLGGSFHVNVNLSPRHLQDPNLHDDVLAALHESGLDPSSLILEITESVFMQDTPDMMDRLKGLRQLGVGLAIDDFGTGYSSLGYLRRFPISTLKVDRTFVKDLGHSVEDSAVVRAIVSLSRTFGLQSVAEGIEGRVELEELQRIGCDFGQGFYFGRPLEAESFRLRLAAQTPASVDEIAARNRV